MGFHVSNLLNLKINKSLKWDIIFGGNGIATLLGIHSHGRLAGPGFGQELYVVGHHIQFTAFLTVIRFPGAELETPLQKHRTTFVQIFRTVFALLSPDGDIDKADFFFPIVTLLVLAVDRQPETGNAG